MRKTFFNKLFFTDLTPIVKLGEKKILNEEDLPSLPSELEPENYPKGFDHLDQSSPFRLYKTITLAVKGPLFWAIVLAMGILASLLVTPIVIYEIVEIIKSSFSGVRDVAIGIGALLILAASNMVSGLIVQHYIHRALSIIVLVNNGIGLLLYRKALRLSDEGLSRSSVGDIINHVSSDSFRIGDSLWAWVEILYAFCSFIAVSIISYFFLGIAGVIGTLTLLIFTPFLRLITKRFLACDHQLMDARDTRVNLLSQVFSNIRIAKYFVWEDKLKEEINQVRSKEVSAQRLLAKTVSLSTLLFVATQTISCLVAFVAASLLGIELGVGNIFALISLFSILDHPFGRLADHLSAVIEGFVASRRLMDYLNLPEVDPAKEKNTYQGRTAIELKNLSASYSSQTLPAIDNISLEVGFSSKIAVVGAVGSGKTSLLRTLVGELPLSSGEIRVNPKICKFSFVPQEPYILNRSIEENIKFGAGDGNLEDAIKFSQLESDIDQMIDGAGTQIGENGVNLSGGQKQRLNLARAIFCSGEVVVLDDALSAVDHNTEDRIVDELIFNHWQNKICIFATHRLKHLERFDQIIFLEHGRVIDKGSYSELLSRCKKFRLFVSNKGPKHSATPVKDTNVEVKPLHSAVDVTNYNDVEDRESGAVAKSLYLDYFRALCGRSSKEKRWMAFFLIATAFIGGLAPLLQNLWLSLWMDNRIPDHWLAGVETSLPWQLWVFGLLCIGGVFCVYLQFRVWALRAVKAGEILHEDALDRVMSSPVKFFDKQPVGRVLNRFSKDIDAIEKELPWNLLEFVSCIMAALVAFIVMVSFVPYAVIFIIPLGFVFHRFQNLYRSSARETKRLYSLSRSPVFSHFKETLDGLDSIRIFKRQTVFDNDFIVHLSESQKMFWAMTLVNRWLSIRIPIIGAGVTLIVGLGSFLLAFYGLLGTGLAALTLLFSTRFSFELAYAVRSFSEVEARLTSVERLRHYGRLPIEKQGASYAGVWKPLSGSIEFRSVDFRYRKDLPLILERVSFKIPHGAKVGIVGRTGAGKSTLFQCLFRFADIEKGSILFDGRDISSIGLAELRQKIAIIPQDPSLFLGTVRSNLDRFSSFSDKKLWEVLDHVQMKEFVAELGGLQGKVSERGSNFSRGQRQLFCFARALLIDAPIVCLDEATASVDVLTDRIIHKVLEKYCEDKTVLIIAHRLETVSHCDFTLQLEGGGVELVANASTNRNKEQIRSPLFLFEGLSAKT